MLQFWLTFQASKVWDHGENVSSPQHPCHGPFTPQGDAEPETHLCNFLQHFNIFVLWGKEETDLHLKNLLKKEYKYITFSQKYYRLCTYVACGSPISECTWCQIKQLIYRQDASHTSTACFLETLALLTTSLLQLCLAPQVQYICSFQQLFSLSPLQHLTSMTHSITVFKVLYQLPLFPFLWKLKFLETLCLQTAAKETGFIQHAILPLLCPSGDTGFSKSPTCRQMCQLFHLSLLTESKYRKGT